MIIFSRKTHGCWVPPFLETSICISLNTPLQQNGKLSKFYTFTLNFKSCIVCAQVSCSHATRWSRPAAKPFCMQQKDYDTWWKMVLTTKYIRGALQSVILNNDETVNKLPLINIESVTLESFSTTLLSEVVIAFSTASCCGISSYTGKNHENIPGHKWISNSALKKKLQHCIQIWISSLHFEFPSQNSHLKSGLQTNLLPSLLK